MKEGSGRPAAKSSPLSSRKRATRKRPGRRLETHNHFIAMNEESTMVSQLAVEKDEIGNFKFPERHKFDAGFGLSEKTVDYISDVKDDPDWVRAFRHRALKVFLDKPMPTHWATRDLENID